MKGKSIGHITTYVPFHACSLNPIDMSMITLVSKEHIKFYRINDKEIRALDETRLDEDARFSCQCWLKSNDDNLLVGSDRGKIYLFRSGEYDNILSCSPGERYPIVSMVAVTNGFFVGSRDGNLLYYQYKDIKNCELYRQFEQGKILSFTGNQLCDGSLLNNQINTASLNYGI